MWFAARYTKCRPSGRNEGQRWVVYFASIFVTAAGVPPLDGTWNKGKLKLGANKMTPLALHVPPRAWGASHTITGGPPAMSTRFSLPSTKNAIERLSGDQKGNVAFSVPGRACSVSSPIERR
jgi:hypothetical protein